eukprot:7863583-Alexandrium_andersonii.AAC.1
MAALWKPLADWLEARTAGAAASAPSGLAWDVVVAAWCLDNAGVPHWYAREPDAAREALEQVGFPTSHRQLPVARWRCGRRATD